MILYLRQAVICPLIPLTSVILDSSNLEKRSELSKIILDELTKLKLQSYLDNIDSIKSTRFKSVLKAVTQYKQKTLLFSCFSTCLDILEHLLQGCNRPVFRMTSEMSSVKRGDLIQQFTASQNGLLLLTYELGGQGLNLQMATTVMLLDYWFNEGRTQQAIGRIFRLGQLAEQINIIFFSANTAIENMIFEKQHAKKQIINELTVGTQTTKIPKMKMDDMIKLIALDDNKQWLQQLYTKK